MDPDDPDVDSGEGRSSTGEEISTALVSEPGAAVDDAGPRTLETGAMVGRYMVLDRIAAGGMGVVYAAYDPELQRRVAVKVLKPDKGGSLGDSDGGTRLLREAQAMARLSHPNVVAVYDVGTLDAQVFLAMELVEGSTLAAWLASETRSYRAVLDTFVFAGRGLAAAHDAGLVHRDFKPSNVLIDEQGRVRVTDFGLARPPVRRVSPPPRPSSSSSLLASPLTATGTVLGTPAYMSPEQHTGDRITPLSDQFSYCVALYEGLYGERPFEGKASDDLLRNALAGRVREVPAASQVPAWVRRAVLRGLEVKPTARWPTMTALIEALGKDPAARRRRWALVALGAATAVAIILGVGELRRQRASLCARAADRLVHAWGDERREAVRRSFLQTALPYAVDTWARVSERLDAYAEQWARVHEQACLATHVDGEQSSDVLDVRMRCLDRRRAELDALSRLLTQADATILENANRAVADLPTLDRCSDVEALSADVPPPEDRNTADRVEALRYQLAEARVLERAGRASEGLPVAERIHEEARALDYPPLVAEALAVLGSLQEISGDYEIAVETLSECVWTASAANHDLMVARGAGMLVYVLGYQLARHEEGLRWGRYARAAAQRLGGEGIINAMVLNNLALTLESAGRYEEAADHLLRSLAIQEATVGYEHPTFASTLSNLGNILHSMGRYEEVVRYQRRALVIRERVDGPDHPSNGISHNTLALAYEAQGLYEAARDHYRRARRIFSGAFGADHPWVSYADNNLGAIEYNLNGFEEARTYYLRALAGLESSFGYRHPAVARASTNLGLVEQAVGNYSAALAYHERALASQEQRLGPDHPDVALVLNNLGSLYKLQRDFDRALPFYRRALALREASLGPAHSRVATTLNNLGEVHRRKGDPERAHSYYRRALTILERSVAPDHPHLALALSGGGQTSLALGRTNASVALLERALTIQSVETADPLERAATRFALARALWMIGDDRGRARTLARGARDDYTRVRATRERAEVERWLAVRP